MEAATVTEGLCEADLEAAWLGFRQLLRRKRFSGRFIENHGEDLLGRARFEYARALAAGTEIYNPTGWLINCAWRRTQNLLEEQSRAPRLVAIDAAGAIADSSAPLPEEEVLERDRGGRVQAAVELLPLEERKVIELCYFEGLSVREVARVLGWDKSKADRRHHAALRRLRALLGVEELDSLAIEIGLAAWVSLAAGGGGGFQLPGGVEAVADATGRELGGLVGRAHELARRFLVGGGGEPTSAVAASGVARSAGVCGAAVLACIASGVVGPGVGGVDLVGGGHSSSAPVHERSVTPTQTAASSASTEPAAVPPPAMGRTAQSATRSKRRAGSNARQLRSKGGRGPGSTSTNQAAQEFSPFFGGSGGSSSASATASSSSSRTAVKPAPPSDSSSSPSPASRQAGQEFGAFR